MSYRKLEIGRLAGERSIDIHKLTLNELPKFEMHEKLLKKLNMPGKKINKFISAIELSTGNQKPESRNKQPVISNQ